MMFNYEAIAKRINLPENRLSEIGKIIRKDFPRDEMMFELHMLRVLMALERKDLTLEDLLKEPGNKGRAERTR
jgi:hypothetical protein